MPADLALGPDEELVAGRRPVEEVLAARRGPTRLIVTPQRRQALERIVLHATNLRIPIVEVEGGTLTALAGFDGHQGVAVVVPARRWATLEEVLARATERDERPFVLALDSLEDPQNVGTLLRTAEAVGAHGVVFPTRRQAPLTPAAIKASSGAVEHLLLAPVDDLASALTELHVRGLRVVGAEADAPLSYREADLRGPLVVVVGSEGQGLGPVVRRRCDVVVRIPMRGAIGSLNAAVAGSIVLFEAFGQRGLHASPPPADAPDARTDQASEAEEAPPRRRRRVPAAPPAPAEAASGDASTAEPDLLPGGPDGPRAAESASTAESATTAESASVPSSSATKAPCSAAPRKRVSRPRRPPTDPPPEDAPA